MWWCSSMPLFIRWSAVIMASCLFTPCSWPFNPRHFQEAVLKTTWIADVITYHTRCGGSFGEKKDFIQFAWTPAIREMPKLMKGATCGAKRLLRHWQFHIGTFLDTAYSAIFPLTGWFVPGDQYDGRHQFQQSDLRIVAAEMPREFIYWAWPSVCLVAGANVDTEVSQSLSHAKSANIVCRMICYALSRTNTN